MLAVVVVFSYLDSRSPWDRSERVQMCLVMGLVMTFPVMLRLANSLERLERLFWPTSVAAGVVLLTTWGRPPLVFCWLEPKCKRLSRSERIRVVVGTISTVASYVVVLGWAVWI